MRDCTKQENKIKCLIHYFGRICRCMPTGFVSFERKILPLEYHPHFVSYPGADSWANSVTPLCSIEVYIETLLTKPSFESISLG